MKTILITGATGNVGSETIKYLSRKNGDFRILAGVREAGFESNFSHFPNVQAVRFDFDDEKSIEDALDQTDILFLLRPPQLSDVKKYFNPVIRLAKVKNIQHIVFLSVQGADTSSLIPHYKIEKLIIDSGIDYTFLRPAYFMQNFITTLRNDIVENDIIFLPAGNAKFTLIDVEDVGEVAAEILTGTSAHTNKAYDLTNDEHLSFKQMAGILSEVLGRKVNYHSPDLISFFIRKRREKIPTMFILVMVMLHYLPRFKSMPPLSAWVKKITGKKPRSFREFVVVNKCQNQFFITLDVRFA